MHMYLLVRGFQDRLARWVNDVTAQHYDWKADDGRTHKVRLMLRPVQLYELVFPEPAYEDVLATVQPYQQDWFGTAKVAALRLALGLKPVQKFVPPNNKIDNNFVAIAAVGVRKDEFHPSGWEML